VNIPRPIGAPSVRAGGIYLNPIPAVAPVEMVTCGICLELCRISSANVVPSRIAPVLQGVYIGATSDKHSYCFPCLRTYIRTKIEDPTPSKVFPINCPEVICACARLLEDGADGVDDLSAEQSKLPTISPLVFSRL
jgi:hypothetical protein